MDLAFGLLLHRFKTIVDRIKTVYCRDRNQQMQSQYNCSQSQGDTKTPFTRAKKSARHAKFLAPCLNNFGTALPIYTTENKRFLSSWARFQFLIGTPSLHLFYSRGMVDKQSSVILHHILRVKCDLNRNSKSHLRFNKEIDRHLGEIRKKKTEGEMVVSSDGSRGLFELP